MGTNGFPLLFFIGITFTVSNVEHPFAEMVVFISSVDS